MSLVLNLAGRHAERLRNKTPHSRVATKKKKGKGKERRREAAGLQESRKRLSSGTRPEEEGSTVLLEKLTS